MVELRDAAPAVSVEGVASEVRLLGGFAITCGGWPVRLPTGSAWLLKLLAVTPAHRLTAVDAAARLWPQQEAGPKLESAIAGLGTLLSWRGDQVLLTRCALDLDEFATAARTALRLRQQPSVYEALALYPGELLPNDRHLDWTTAPRRALGELHLELLELAVRIARSQQARSGRIR